MKRITFAKTTYETTKLEKENRIVSYEAACEGIVLLKNDGSLPLKNKKIACFGQGVKHTIKGGTGSGEVNERYAINIYEGLINAGFNITSSSWLNDYEEVFDKAYDKFFHGSFNLFKVLDIFNGSFSVPFGRCITDDDILESDTDTAIYVVARQAGEGNDKKLANGDFNLKQCEIDDINKMASSYKHSILVINSGSYMDISEVVDNVSAIIFFVQQGEEGGNALADILTGKVNPSGKLTDTWAKHYSDISTGKTFSYLSGDTKNEDYSEGIYVGYRYFDTFNVEPRFPFGFGLSYTTFDISTKNVTINKDIITLDIDVLNTGKCVGKEVVEVYVSCPNGNLLKEQKRLVNFKKTKSLNINELESLSINFTLYDISSYDEESSSYILEKGNYIISVGNSSDNIKAVSYINIENEIIIKKLTNICPIDKKLDEIIPSVNKLKVDVSNLIELKIDVSNIEEEVINYTLQEEVQDERVQKILNTLTPKELCTLCCGEGFKGNLSTNKVYVPGAVGRTTDTLYKKGVINVLLSDGPAGIRLLKESALNKKGKMKYVEGNYLFEAMKRISTKLMKPFLAKKDDERLYQYLTSIPVATSLAQTWNEELLEKVGKLISSEMTEYGVTYWLAPALNIHRNPLCGRNFEYFSEDPVVSGKVAAAITRGVQSTKGNYVTIKHFCCNNQEDNRTHSNSHVSERTLREIYLKGFEICVKESDPKSVMTSYNLVNGIYTPDWYDLNTKALRNEWGFNGVVMTDWYSTMLGQGSNHLAIKAGNDMIMPGGSYFRHCLMRAYRWKKLSLKELRIAASNILYQILESKVAESVNPNDFE